jgi:hypothetical protein
MGPTVKKVKGQSQNHRPPLDLKPAPPSKSQVHLSIKFKPKPSIPYFPASLPDVSPQDLRALEFFRSKTASVMSGWIVDQFWQYQLPQVAQSEPIVRHAIIALSATHEAMVLYCNTMIKDSSLLMSIDELERKRYACRHYNEAVSQLAKVLSSGADREIVAMITCSLFVILKFMLGEFSTAVLHMHNEIEIFDCWRKSKPIQYAEGSLESNLTKLIEHQCFRSVSIEASKEVLYSEDHELLLFRDFADAEQALLSLCREGLRLIRLHRILTSNFAKSQLLTDFQNELAVHYVDLQIWLSRFEAILAIKQGCMSIEEERDGDKLNLMYLSTFVWLYAGLASLESSHQEPTELYGRFLDQGDALHSKWCWSTIYNGFTSLSCCGIIPPLTYISVTTSNANLRTKACRLIADASGMSYVSDEKAEAPEQPVYQAETGTIEVEIEPGMEQVNLVLQLNHTGGWEVVNKNLP